MNKLYSTVAVFMVGAIMGILFVLYVLSEKIETSGKVDGFSGHFSWSVKL